jgi:hypothetical protein
MAYWSTDGNGGNPAGSFLGTTDAQPLVVQINNVEQFRVEEGQLVISSPRVAWGNGSTLDADQGGSIELMGPGTPYIDFHFSGASQDYNVRIINDADGQLTLAAPKVHMTGELSIDGDILLTGADWAENFRTSAEGQIESGDVVVMDGQGGVRKSGSGYDKCVAGVVSGAGDTHPGVILGRVHDTSGSVPVALAGRVMCKAEASIDPISIGDLLTTSSFPGYAMKASDRSRAFGAVLGKAMADLKTGSALIPVIVSLL